MALSLTPAAVQDSLSYGACARIYCEDDGSDNERSVKGEIEKPPGLLRFLDYGIAALRNFRW